MPGPALPRGTYANRPVAARPGSIYFPSDGVWLSQYNGTSWVECGPIFPMVEPPTTGWTWVNQGTATIDDDQGYLSLAVADNGSANPACRVRSVGGTYDIEINMDVTQATATADNEGGLLWNDSATDNGVLVRLVNQQILVQQFTAPSTYGTTYTTYAVSSFPQWFRMRDDGVNRYLYVSPDGHNWSNPIYTATRTTHITANEVGFYARSQNTANSRAVVTTIHSWDE